LGTKPLVFGIYAGGQAGGDTGLLAGPTEDPGQIERALSQLQGSSSPFIVRAYEHYDENTGTNKPACQAPYNFSQYLHGGRRLDLVLLFQSKRGDVAGFCEFVRGMVRRHAEHLYSIQITEEANFTDGPDCIDGPYPNVLDALVQGVITAKREAMNVNPAIKVGFNSTPTFGPSAEFWAKLAAIGGEDFRNSVDYVGLDFFPDVFRPVAPDGEAGDLRSSVIGVLELLRSQWLPAAGIPDSVRIHIAEHGWPTGPTRSEQRQADVIETTIRAVWDLRERLKIERYTIFGLRDVDSQPESADDIFKHFGIMHADYTSKPAFERYRRLVAEFGVR